MTKTTTPTHSAAINNLLPLIDEIYAAATDGSRLQGVLSKVADYIGADAGAMAIGSRKTGNTRYLILTPEDQQGPDNLQSFTFFDPWRKALLFKEADCMYPNTELIDQQSLENSRFFQQWLSDYQISHGCSGYVHLKADYVCYLGFGRNASKPLFSHTELAAIEQVMPHLKRAYQLNSFIDRLSILYDATEQHNQAAIGYLLLDDEAQLIFSNEYADQLLKAPGGVCIADGRLCLETEADNHQLYEIINQLCSQPAAEGQAQTQRMMVVRHWNDQPPLTLSISPHTNRLASKTLMTHRGRIMVTVFDPSQQPRPREELLAGLYALSQQETELTLALADGATLAEISRSTHISKETLRSQLKRIFHKTGTHRQSELIKLILSGPAANTPPHPTSTI